PLRGCPDVVGWQVLGAIRKSDGPGRRRQAKDRATGMARVVGPRSKRRKGSGQKRALPGRGKEKKRRKGRIRTIRRKLLRWGRTNYKHYPWRSETDPWLSFLAELLLQRTRASQVEPVFINIQERFPTAASLAVGGLAAVNGLTSKLGLHRRGPVLL